MCGFNVLLHLLFFLTIYKCYLASYSVLAILQESENLARKACMHIYYSKAALPGKPTVANVRFVSVVVTCFYITDLLVSQRSWVRYPVWPHTFVSPAADSRGAVVSYWRKYVRKVLVNRLGGLSLPRKSVVRLTDRPDMTLDVYRGRKTTTQQQQQQQQQQDLLV